MSEEKSRLQELGEGYVVDLASFRLAQGRTKRGVERCEHRHLILDQSGREIECADCGRPVEPFEAVLVIYKHLHKMTEEARSRLARAKEAEAATIGLRAARVFDRAWRGNQMAVCCPHCRTGLLPEDFLSGGSQVSAEIERARRTRQAKDPTP